MDYPSVSIMGHLLELISVGNWPNFGVKSGLKEGGPNDALNGELDAAIMVRGGGSPYNDAFPITLPER